MEPPTYVLKLACGHVTITDVKLMLQYPTDQHYVYCPVCRNTKGKFAPTAWQFVVSQREVTEDALMYHVRSGTSLVMPQDILRLQPSKPPERQRPYIYTNQSKLPKPREGG